MTKSRIALLVLVCTAIAAFFGFDLGQYFHLAYFKAQQGHIQSMVDARPLLSAAVFFLINVAVAALSLPGAVMTLIAGALFGMLWGTLLVSFASSIGATLAFLTARFFLRDWIQNKYGKRLDSINRGIEKDGVFYLFMLRLVPVLPFIVVNLIMALTPMRLTTFYGVSQLGMLPDTLVFVYAGTQIATIDHLSDVLSPGLILAFVLLGVFPLLARKIVARI